MKTFRKFTMAEFITFLCYSLGFFLIVFLIATTIYVNRMDYIIFMLIFWPVSYELTRGLGFIKATS